MNAATLIKAERNLPHVRFPCSFVLSRCAFGPGVPVVLSAILATIVLQLPRELIADVTSLSIPGMVVWLVLLLASPVSVTRVDDEKSSAALLRSEPPMTCAPPLIQQSNEF
jgi:hypothetical protein